MTQLAGREAMALCQYAWSWKTVATRICESTAGKARYRHRTLTVSNDVDDTKDQSVLGPHRDVTPVSISGNRSLLCSCRQECVHLADASNLVARGVDSEDEDKDDREEYGGMGAVLQNS